MQRFRDGFTRDTADAHAGRALGTRRRRRRARGGAARPRAGRRAARPWHRFQLRSGARSRPRRQRRDRRPGVPSQPECRRASRVRLSSTGCAPEGWPASASIFRDMATSPPIRTRTCRSTTARSRRSPPTISFRSARWCSAGSKRSCRRTSSIRPSTPRPRAIRASGCRRSCAAGSDSTASSSPTTSAWPARRAPAISSPAPKRRWPRAATWCSPATISRPPMSLLARWKPAPQPRPRAPRRGDGTAQPQLTRRQYGCGQRPPTLRVSSSAVCATIGPSCRIRSSGSRDDGPASEIAPSGSACSS